MIVINYGAEGGAAEPRSPVAPSLGAGGFAAPPSQPPRVATAAEEPDDVDEQAQRLAMWLTRDALEAQEFLGEAKRMAVDAFDKLVDFVGPQEAIRLLRDFSDDDSDDE